MIKSLKKYFIPHKNNDHQPHLLRKRAVLAILVFILLVEGFFLVQIFLLFPNTNLFSSILPNVLVDLTNKDRGQNEIAPLVSNLLLEQAAMLKAQDMAENGYFAHTSPSGATPWYWLQKVGYAYSGAGENLAVNFSDSADIENAWMNSPAHRQNILDNRFSEIGIATAKGLYNGREAIFVVQFFGRPELSSALSKVQASAQTAPKNPAAVPPKPTPAQNPVSLAEPGNMAIQNIQSNQTSSDLVAGALTLSDDSGKAPLRASRWQRLLSMPKKMITLIYLVIAGIVLLALALKIFVKIKIQYPKLIFNGVLVLFVIISLLYLNYLLIQPGQIF